MKINEIRQLSSVLGNLPVKGISVSSIRLIIELDKELKKESETHAAMQEKLFDSYGIKPNPEQGGNYVWSDHKDAKVITAKVNELYNLNVDIKNKNFLTENELYDACSELKVAEISTISESLLMRKEEPKKKVKNKD